MKGTNMNRTVTKGNVFKELGFTDEESAVFAMKVELAVEIEKFLKREKLTQTKAAGFFGTTQGKISSIVNGDVKSFSIDYLAKLATKAGKVPRISFSRRRATV